MMEKVIKIAGKQEISTPLPSVPLILNRMNIVDMETNLVEKMDTEEQREVQKSKKTEAQFVLTLIKNGLFLQRKLGQVCQQFTLNTNQFVVINEIILKGSLSQKELCKRLLFEKFNVSKIVKTLQAKELISVSAAPVDRRSTLLIETVKGIEVWKDCLQSFNNSCTDLMSFLSDGEIIDTLELLKIMGKSFGHEESQ